MIKMIITAPRNVDVELICNTATTLAREEVGKRNESDRNYYDYDLGDYVSWVYPTLDTPKEEEDKVYRTPYNVDERRVTYSVSADFVTMGLIVELMKLQTICPFEIHFENCGDGANEASEYWIDDPEDYEELFGEVYQKHFGEEYCRTIF